MAPSPLAGLTSLARPSSSHLSRAGGVFQPVPLQPPQGRRHRRRVAGVARAAPDSPPVVRAAVSAVTELLRALSPSKKPPRMDAAREDEEPGPPPCGSVEDVLAVLEDDYRRAYFLTGTVSCTFAAACFRQGLLGLDHGGCQIAEPNL
jgi:hypothetical protein